MARREGLHWNGLFLGRSLKELTSRGYVMRRMNMDRVETVTSRAVVLVVLFLALGCGERTNRFMIPTQLAGTQDAGGTIITLPDGGVLWSEVGVAGTDGNWEVRIPGCAPTAEQCNAVDDDCDGVIDNGFDLTKDPGNCGACGVICSFPRATSTCQASACAILECSAGYVDLDQKTANGCECLQSNNGKELCDGADNDCNGVVDDGFDLQNDPGNCGACGVVCGAANASPSCVMGVCKFDCKPGYFDSNKLPADGCEYACAALGPEICDGKDNDCNGLRDADDPGLVYTPADRVCFSGEPGACQAGQLTCIAGTMVCMGAGMASDEICDGRDNNCDGVVDEADPNLGKTCYTSGASGCDLIAGTCKGECKLGAFACTKGTLACKGMVTPVLEACDGKDNDCDGVADNGFDLDVDPRNCGGCGHACALPHAIVACRTGVCALDPKNGVGACETGYVDANHSPADGCELACVPTGPEVCDGKDNDCNGLVDDADPGLLYPTNFCVQTGECGKGPGGSTHAGWETAKTFPACAVPTGSVAGTAPTWVCNYPATVQLAATNQVIGQETWCDGLDNDCDGAADDAWSAQLATGCVDPGSTAVGACLRRGTMKCQADKTLAPACDFGGQATAASPTDEICDGIDNDCDGMVDEPWDNPAGLTQCSGHDCLGVRDAIVHVTAAGAPGGGYYIYQYEASRVDATATTPGAAETRACSRAQNPANQAVLPWNQVTWSRANTACKAAGMRLCKVTRSGATVTADEWGFACGFGNTCADTTYPYSCSYTAGTCNGSDGNRNTPTTCGALASCVTSGNLDTATTVDQVFDMSGNVAEWTDDLRNTITDAGANSAIYTTRGGAFDSFFRGMTCDFMGTQLHPNFSHPDTGFRCCSSCAAGQADCSGSCKSLATDGYNCGGCGTTCLGGTTCQNGVCK